MLFDIILTIIKKIKTSLNEASMTIELSGQFYQHNQIDALFNELRSKYVSRKVVLVCSADMNDQDIFELFEKINTCIPSLPCRVQIVNAHNELQHDQQLENIYFRDKRKQFADDMKVKIERAEGPVISQVQKPNIHKSILNLFSDRGPVNAKVAVQQQQQQQQQQAQKQDTTITKPRVSKKRLQSTQVYVDPKELDDMITRENITEDDELRDIYNQHFANVAEKPSLLVIWDNLVGERASYITDKRKTITGVKRDAMIQIIRHHKEFAYGIVPDNLPVLMNELGGLDAQFTLEETGFGLCKVTSDPLLLSRDETCDLLKNHVGYIQYADRLFYFDKVNLQDVSPSKKQLLKSVMDELEYNHFYIKSAYETHDAVQRVLCYVTNCSQEEKDDKSALTVTLSRHDIKPSSDVYFQFYSTNVNAPQDVIRTEVIEHVQVLECVTSSVNNVKDSFNFFLAGGVSTRVDLINSRLSSLKALNKVELNANFYRGLANILVSSGDAGVLLFLNYVLNLKDISLIIRFLDEPLNYLQWTSKDGFEKLEQLFRSDIEKGFSSAQQDWWKRLVSQHEARVDFNDLFKAYTDFISILQLGPHNILPEICPFSDVKHMKVGLARLVYIVKPHIVTPEEAMNDPEQRNQQLDLLKGGSDLGPLGAYHGVRYDGLHLVSHLMGATLEHGVLLSNHEKQLSYSMHDDEIFASRMVFSSHNNKIKVNREKDVDGDEELGVGYEDTERFFYRYIGGQSQIYPWESYNNIVEGVCALTEKLMLKKKKKNESDLEEQDNTPKLGVQKKAYLLYILAMASAGKRACVIQPQEPYGQLQGFLDALRQYAKNIKTADERFRDGDGLEYALKCMHGCGFRVETSPTLGELITILNLMPSSDAKLAHKLFPLTLGLIKHYGAAVYDVIQNHNERLNIQINAENTGKPSVIKPVDFAAFVLALDSIYSVPQMQFLTDQPDMQQRLITVLSLLGDSITDQTKYEDNIKFFMTQLSDLTKPVYNALLTQLCDIDLIASEGLPTFDSLGDMIVKIQSLHLMRGCDLILMTVDTTPTKQQLQDIWLKNGKKPILCKLNTNMFRGRTQPDYYFYGKQGNDWELHKFDTEVERECISHFDWLFSTEQTSPLRIADYDYAMRPLYDCIVARNWHSDMTIAAHQLPIAALNDVMLRSLDTTGTAHGKNEFEESSLNFVSMFQKFVLEKNLKNCKKTLGDYAKSLYSGMGMESAALSACHPLIEETVNFYNVLIDADGWRREQVNPDDVLDQLEKLDKVMKNLLTIASYLIHPFRNSIISLIQTKMTGDEEKIALPLFFEKKTLKVFLGALFDQEFKGPMKASIRVLKGPTTFRDYLANQLILNDSDDTNNNFHILSVYPDDIAKYKSSYLWIADNELVYVTWNGKKQNVTINNVDLFKRNIALVIPQSLKEIHLSDEQISKNITSNGGHTPEPSMRKCIQQYKERQAALNQFINLLGALQNQNKTEYLKCVDLLNNQRLNPLLTLEDLNHIFKILINQKKWPISDQLACIFEILKKENRPANQSISESRFTNIVQGLNVLVDEQEKLTPTVVKLLFKSAFAHNLTSDSRFPLHAMMDLQKADSNGQLFKQFIHVVSLISKYNSSESAAQILNSTAKVLEKQAADLPNLRSFVALLLKNIKLDTCCCARVLLSEPTDADKNKVMSLNEVLIIRTKDVYELAFCNQYGTYERKAIADDSVKQVLSSYRNAGQYILNDDDEEKLNEVLKSFKSKSHLDRLPLKSEQIAYADLLSKIPSDQQIAEQWLTILVALGEARQNPPNLKTLNLVAELLQDVNKLAAIHSLFKTPPYPPITDFIEVMVSDEPNALEIYKREFDLHPYNKDRAKEINDNFKLNHESISRVVGGMTQYLENQGISEAKQFNLVRQLSYVNAIGKGFCAEILLTDPTLEDKKRIIESKTILVIRRNGQIEVGYCDHNNVYQQIVVQDSAILSQITNRYQQSGVITKATHLHEIKKYVIERGIDTFDRPLIRRSGDGQSVAYMLREMSRAELHTLVEQLKADIRDDTSPKGDRKLQLHLLAVLRELYCRGTGMNPNSTQLLSILLALEHPTNLLLQIDTGEGKSVTTALFAAMRCAKGRTVHVPTANRTLVNQDYHDQQNKYFFTLAGMESAVVESGSKRYTHKVGGINYGTTGDLSIYRSTAKLRGESLTTVRGGDGTTIKIDVIWDEADKILDDRTQYNYSMEKEGGGDLYYNPNEWMYYEILNFIASSNEFQRMDMDQDGNPAWDQEERIRQLKIYLESGEKTSEQRRQVGVLTRDDLEIWLISVCDALGLNRGRDYAISLEPTKRTINEEEIEVNIATPVDANGVPQDGASYLEGRHQFLHGFLSKGVKHSTEKFKTILAKRAGVTGNFPIDAETMCVATESASAYLSGYLDEENGGDIIALTGTSGMKDERLELHKKFNLLSFKIPPHKENRRDELPPFVIENKNNNTLVRDKAIIAAIEQHADIDDALMRQPVLVIAEDMNQAKAQYDALFAKFGDRVQLITGMESDAERTAALVIAGKPNMITVGTPLLGRGTDIKPEHKQGLFVIQTYLDTLRNTRQIIGRAARKGNLGKYLAIYSEPGFEFLRFPVLNFSLGLSQAEQHKQIDAMQKTLSENAAIERHYMQEVDDIQQILLKQFDAWMSVLLGGGDESRKTFETEIFTLRAKLIQHVSKTWGDRLSESDYNNIYQNPYIRRACGLMKMSDDPKKMSVDELSVLLDHKPSYVLFNSKVYYIDREFKRIELHTISFDQLKAIFPDHVNELNDASQENLAKITSLTGHIRCRQEKDSSLEAKKLNETLALFEKNDELGVSKIWSMIQKELINIKMRLTSRSDAENVRFEYLEKDNLVDDLTYRKLKLQHERLEMERLCRVKEDRTKRLVELALDPDGAVLAFDGEQLSSPQKLTVTQAHAKTYIDAIFNQSRNLRLADKPHETISVRIELLTNKLLDAVKSPTERVAFQSAAMECMDLYNKVHATLPGLHDFDNSHSRAYIIKGNIKKIELLYKKDMANNLADDVIKHLSWAKDRTSFYCVWMEPSLVVNAADVILKAAEAVKKAYGMDDKEQQQEALRVLNKALNNYQVMLSNMWYYFPFGEYFFGYKDTRKVIADTLNQFDSLVRIDSASEQLQYDSYEAGKCQAYLARFTDQLQALQVSGDGWVELRNHMQEIQKENDGLAVVDELLHYLGTPEVQAMNLTVKSTLLSSFSSIFMAVPVNPVQTLIKSLTTVREKITNDDLEVDPVRGRLFMSNKERSLTKALGQHKTLKVSVNPGHTGFSTYFDVVIQGKVLVENFMTEYEFQKDSRREKYEQELHELLPEISTVVDDLKHAKAELELNTKQKIKMEHLRLKSKSKQIASLNNVYRIVNYLTTTRRRLENWLPWRHAPNVAKTIVSTPASLRWKNLRNNLSTTVGSVISMRECDLQKKIVELQTVLDKLRAKKIVLEERIHKSTPNIMFKRFDELKDLLNFEIELKKNAVYMVQSDDETRVESVSNDDDFDGSLEVDIADLSETSSIISSSDSDDDSEFESGSGFGVGM